METNIKLISVEEKYLRAFRGPIKPERWDKLLETDDVGKRVMERIMGEEAFNYKYVYRVNCDIVGTFAAILLTLKIPKCEVICACIQLFNDKYCNGILLAINSINNDLMIPFPEDYYANPMGSLANSTLCVRRPILVFKDNKAFYNRLGIIRRNVDFLLKWIRVKPSEDVKWVKEYLDAEGFKVEADFGSITLEDIQMFPPAILRKTTKGFKAVKGKRRFDLGIEESDEEELVFHTPMRKKP